MLCMHATTSIRDHLKTISNANAGGQRLFRSPSKLDLGQFLELSEPMGLVAALTAVIQIMTAFNATEHRRPPFLALKQRLSSVCLQPSKAPLLNALGVGR